MGVCKIKAISVMAILSMFSGASHAVVNEEVGKQLLYCAFIVGNSPAPNEDVQKQFNEYRNQLIKTGASYIPKDNIKAAILEASGRFEDTVRLRNEGKADRSLLQEQMKICDTYMSSAS